MKAKEVLLLLGIGVAILVGYDVLDSRIAERARSSRGPSVSLQEASDEPAIPPAALLEEPPVASSPAAPRFECDGRTRCGQMKSCDEAKFFLQNCPNTEMDGDHDGEPCEQQWCR